MASWNSSLQINKLVEEINDIGEYVGYYWSLIPNDNNITISGSNNDYSVSVPNTNNTSYAYSNLTRNDNWTITCVAQANSNMFIGVAESLSADFPGAFSPSMKMVNYGVLMDTQGAVNDLYPIVNGVLGIAYNITAGQTLKMTYDGITLKFFVDNVEETTFQQTVSIDPIHLVVGSAYGGSIKNITFTGSGSGSGGTLNLEEVLQNGNNANNLDITNLNNLYVSQIHKNPSGAVITINDNVSAQNIYATQGLDLAENQAVKFNLSGGDTMNIYADTTNPELQFEYEDENNITTQLLNINKSNMTFTFGEQDIDDPTIPTLKVQGVANNIPFEGLVLDTVINPPNIYINSVINNQTTKNIISGTPTSILKIDTGVYNYYNCFNSLLKTLSFQNNILSANPNNEITALFYLSDTLNEDVDETSPLYAGYTTTNINVIGGNPNVNLNNIILSNIFGSGLTDLYLNVKISSIVSCECQFTDFNINMFSQGEINFNTTINPVILT